MAIPTNKNWAVDFIGKIPVEYTYLEYSGSFENLEIANKLVNAVIQANTPLVDKVIRGDFGREYVALQKKFDQVTGFEAYRASLYSEPEIRDTYLARAVLQYYPANKKNGFSIVTAFPTNSDLYGPVGAEFRENPDGDTLAPEAFRSFATNLDMEFYLTEDLAGARDIHLMIGEVLANRSEARNAALKDYLEILLTEGASDQDLMALWRSAGTMYRFSPGTHRFFYSNAQIIIHLNQNLPK
ncbi:MAG: hypothetical protein KDJ16_05295 [Hyphomicrobiales bacterium]|nr:hypothetical protein [Hyphomicrobiales bacterium]